MDKKHKILELRERLDKTLAMPDLVNEESIKSLIRDQLLRASFSGNEGNIGNVVEKRTKEVSNFLEMLRSASGKDQKADKVHSTTYNEWKVKQDTDELRVMYREGPHGTPFHTLLTEGFADGPIDVCLCVSWETTLYKKWWPQYNIPTFKITMANCLQKICIGEEISLVRVKAAWPVSDREALLHYFEIEYFKEDLIIVLLNTISDEEHIDVSTYGFTRDGIPEAKDTVRIDLVGGFVLQKVDSNRSYFRHFGYERDTRVEGNWFHTIFHGKPIGHFRHLGHCGFTTCVIANMDIKLDFVPPTLINFIARQLIGNGHKLYQKAVGSVATSDTDYRQALQGPLYARIREGLDYRNKLKTTLAGLNEDKHKAVPPEERSNSYPLSAETKPHTEIVEEETEQNQPGSSINQMILSMGHVSKEDSSFSPEQNQSGPSSNVILHADKHVSNENMFISPEVDHALRILDQAIGVLRKRGFSDSNQSNCFSFNQEIPPSKAVVNSCSISNKDSPQNSTSKGTKPSKGSQLTSDAEGFRNNCVNKTGEGDSDDQREFVLLKERILAPDEKLTADDALTVTQPPVSESMRKVCDEDSLKVNGFHRTGSHHGGKSKSSSNRGNKKKQGLCCLNMNLFQS